MEKARIGYIGVGLMGLPMAARLVTRGYRVTAYDIARDRMDAARRAGAQTAASAEEAARGADLVILNLPTTEAVERAALGEAGVWSAVKAPQLIVDFSTIRPATARELAAKLRAATGTGWIDAPVSGGPPAAGDGTLTVMAGGSGEDLARAMPLLEDVAARVTHLGPVGSGLAAKMINQLLCGVHIAAAAEAMHVAERAGVSLTTMHEIISVSAGNSWMWGDRGPRMMQDDPPVTSAVDIFVKDLGIVLDQGKLMRQGLPLSAAAMQMFLAASGLGHGKADDSQVIRAYRALNGKHKA